MRFCHPLRALALSLGATFVLAAAPAVAQTTTLKMNISLSQNSHYGAGVDTFAREVEKRTNGRYKVQNFYSGALGGQRGAPSASRSRRCNSERSTSR